MIKNMPNEIVTTRNTNYETEKSRFGKDLTYLFAPREPLKPYEITMGEVPSTFSLTQEQQEEIARKFKEANVGEDGTKWRYEGVEPWRNFDNGIRIKVSPIMYSQHFIRRKTPGLKISEWPNPFTINTLQITKDKKLLIAVRNLFGSDQKGLAALGSGFCDRYTNAIGTDLPPASSFVWSLREILHEGDYAYEFPFDFAKTRFIGIINGSNRDTTGMYVLPLLVNADQVRLNPKNISEKGAPEHSGLIAMEATPERLKQFLEEGGIFLHSEKDREIKKAEAPDHLLGGVELLLDFWKAGQLQL